MVSERRLIDCDIHQEFGDPEEFLAFIEPGQRDWFRAQASFGLPGYTWSHPSAWFRQDLEHEPGSFPPPGSSTSSEKSWTGTASRSES